MRYLVATSILLHLGVVRAVPPYIPDPEIAQVELDVLIVAKSLSGSGYSREKFDHWHSVQGSCNTRETVLERDGEDVVTDNACRSTSGRWYSPFDGATWTKASDVDIDHMVPLKNAWISGARLWSDEEREVFANDLQRPQLWAVTDEVNQEKSDRTPADWKPPLKSFYCDYASSWIDVKYYWNLTVTTPEKEALQDMIDTCGKETSSGSQDEDADQRPGQDEDADNGAGRLGGAVLGLAVSLATLALVL